MKYFDIGQRIRRYRKACGLSQEALAQKVGISVTHMSHIETGNTKLSLPVLAKIAEELSVGTDALLSDAPNPTRRSFPPRCKRFLIHSRLTSCPLRLRCSERSEIAWRNAGSKAFFAHTYYHTDYFGHFCPKATKKP